MRDYHATGDEAAVVAVSVCLPAKSRLRHTATFRQCNQKFRSPTLTCIHVILMVLTLAAGSGLDAAETRQRMTLTLDDAKATILVDGELPLSCMTAAMDAATDLGYDGITVSQVAAAKQALSPTGVSFIVNIETDTVTFRSLRPVPSKVVIYFLQRLELASISKVRFTAVDDEAANQERKQTAAPESESRGDLKAEDQ